MNYQKIYSDFIKNRRIKEKGLIGYFEKHHIIPRARGGNNSPENIIKLSAIDHIHAHVLLAKIYGGTMWFAIMLIVKRASNKNKIPTRMDIRLAAKVRTNSPSHSKEARLKMSKANKGRKCLESTKLKLSQINKGNIPSEETRRKISLANKGRITSNKTKRKISESHKGKKLSDTTKMKLSRINKGKTHSMETRKKISLSNMGKPGPNKGKRASDETRAKQSNSRKGKVHSVETLCKMRMSANRGPRSEETKRKISENSGRAIKCDTTNQIFKSCSDAARHFKMNRQVIERAVKDSRLLKKSGLLFSYI